MTRRVVFLVLLTLAAAPFCRAQSGETTTRVVLEEVVARVNNEIITLSELEQGRDLLRKELAEKYHGAEFDKKFEDEERNILRDLIDQALLVQKALELGISVEADVIKRMDRIRQDLKLPDMEALERYMAERSVNVEDYKLQLRNSLLTQYVVQKEVAGKIFLDSQDVRDYYLRHREEFNRPEQVRLREILVSTEKVPADQLPAREARVQEVLTKIRAGQKFDEVAKQYSDAPTAADGGDLGYFEPEKLAPTIRDILNSLRDGGVSDPIQTPQGWLILQKVEHVPAGIQPYEKVETEIREKLYFEQMQPAIRDYLSQLRRENYVYVKPGYFDAGAVEAEKKPVRRGRRRRAGSKRD